MKNIPALPSLALGLVCTWFAGMARADDASPDIRVYALDCGRIDVSDMSLFSDAGEYDGRTGKLVDPCYLIRHPAGDLLWDTGLPASAATESGSMPQPGMKLAYPVSLGEQLAQLGLAPGDIEFVAFSHMHFDHTGGANTFTQATWLLNQRELAWATAPETVASGLSVPDLFSAYPTVATQLFDGDFDVFGDGSVRILRAPGHTPGHQVLLVSLARAGKVVLGGDLYHTKENQREGRVPVVNTDRADTLASFDRLQRLVRAKRARFFVQHSPEDFAAFPKFPHYLQ